MGSNFTGRYDTRFIGEIVREQTGIAEDKLEQALEVVRQVRQTGKEEPLCDVLVRLNSITAEDKAKCLGKQWGLPYIDLDDVEIDPKAVKMLPERLLREQKILPISAINKTMTLAIVDPLNVHAVDEAHIVSGCDIVPLITTEDSLVAHLNKLTGVSEDSISNAAKDLSSNDDGLEFKKDDTEELSIEQLASGAEEEPIIRLVNAILARGISSGASDIHIQPERDKVRVRYRNDGVLHDGPALPYTVMRPVTSRIKVISHMDIAEKRIPQDGRLSLRTNNEDFDLRVSTLPGIFGEKIVMRIAKQASGLSGISKLGFLANDRKRFDELIVRPYGMILVTGPTGSGKSTTLYAALNQLNSPMKNIITIEDPVEQKIAGLTQIEVNRKAGLNFPAVLRSVLRQDPNIVMVGEIRDRETAVLATEASLTGHLVLSTLHTNDAAGAITRLLDMEVEPFLITSSTIGVLAQRLVRVLCPKCKQEYEASALALRRLGFTTTDPNAKVKLFKHIGCSYCGGTGYKGRMGVFELLVITDEVKQLVLKGANASMIRAQAQKQGMTKMADDAIAKILSGVTSVEEALRVVDVEQVNDFTPDKSDKSEDNPADKPKPEEPKKPA